MEHQPSGLGRASLGSKRRTCRPSAPQFTEYLAETKLHIRSFMPLPADVLACAAVKAQQITIPFAMDKAQAT